MTRVGFYLYACGNGIADGLVVRWNGMDIATESTPSQGTWYLYSYTVQATADTTNIQLGALRSNSTNAGPLVDDVVVSAVPIPAATWLLGSGLIGLVALKRRNKK